MKFELRQQFRIESSRFLPHLQDGHPCKRIHGHSFLIELILRGEQDPHTGWVRDYHEISLLMADTLAALDHRLLNEVAGLPNPTSENLCAWIYNKAQTQIPELWQVIVKETPSTECRYPIR